VVDGDFARYLRRVAVVALIACAATGCGRKGALEPAPGADTTTQKADQSAGGDQPASGGVS
jgi:predicted small lipoprotein YifL